MSVDGFYVVRFASVAGERVQRESGGVVMLLAGRVFGGDTWSSYSGSYQVQGQRVELNVDISIHFTEGGESILGGPLTPYTLHGFAEIQDSGKQLHIVSHAGGDDSARIVAILTKAEEIPQATV